MSAPLRAVLVTGLSRKRPKRSTPAPERPMTRRGSEVHTHVKDDHLHRHRPAHSAAAGARPCAPAERSAAPRAPGRGARGRPLPRRRFGARRARGPSGPERRGRPGAGGRLRRGDADRVRGGAGLHGPHGARPDPDAVPAPRAARAVLRGRGRARGLPGQRRPGTAPPRSPAGRARSGLDRSRPGARVHPRVPRRRLVGRRPRRARRVRRLRGLRRRRVAVRGPLRPLRAAAPAAALLRRGSTSSTCSSCPSA